LRNLLDCKYGIHKQWRAWRDETKAMHQQDSKEYVSDDEDEAFSENDEKYDYWYRNMIGEMSDEEWAEFQQWLLLHDRK